jgi:hypothetical protein
LRLANLLFANIKKVDKFEAKVKSHPQKLRNEEKINEVEEKI